MNQIVGRAIRCRSHHAPCEHKHVDVYIYKVSVCPGTAGGAEVFDYQILVDAATKWKPVPNMLQKVLKPASTKNAKSKN